MPFQDVQGLQRNDWQENSWAAQGSPGQPRVAQGGPGWPRVAQGTVLWFCNFSCSGSLGCKHHQKCGDESAVKEVSCQGILGHGAFAVENLRTCLEYSCKQARHWTSDQKSVSNWPVPHRKNSDGTEVYMICRRKNLACPRAGCPIIYESKSLLALVFCWLFVGCLLVVCWLFVCCSLVVGCFLVVVGCGWSLHQLPGRRLHRFSGH